MEQITIRLRRNSKILPENRSQYESLFPIEEITIKYPELDNDSLPHSPPVLKRTDTDGYYCVKRAAPFNLICRLENGSVTTLEEALQQEIKFFLDKDYSISTYNGIEYVTMRTDNIIESLLKAYEDIKEYGI